MLDGKGGRTHFRDRTEFESATRFRGARVDSPSVGSTNLSSLLSMVKIALD